MTEDSVTRQIAGQLRAQITNGAFGPGALLLFALVKGLAYDTWSNLEP